MSEQRTVENILDNLDEILEDAWELPLSGGKRLVDIEEIRVFVDEIRMNLPIEIRKARAIVADREDIISVAKQEAADIVAKAEQRAKALVEENEITKLAQVKAKDIENEALNHAREMRTKTYEFVDKKMAEAEEVVKAVQETLRVTAEAAKANSDEIKNTRMKLRSRQ